jgi:hypothetical protein
MAFKQTVNYVDLKSTVTFTDLNGIVQYVNLSAVDVTLDAFSKDLFFIVGHPNAEIFAVSEALAVTFSKVLADTPIITEALASSFAKALADTPSVSETLEYSFGKSIANSTSISEALASSFAKSLADTPSVSESVAYSFGKAVADSATVEEQHALAFSLSAQADTASVSESFSRVVSFVRTFTESINLIDTASNDDPLTTDWSTGIGHSTTLSDSSAFALSTPASDSMSMSEVLASSFAKALADTLLFQKFWHIVLVKLLPIQLQYLKH